MARYHQAFVLLPFTPKFELIAQNLNSMYQCHTRCITTVSSNCRLTLHHHQAPVLLPFAAQPELIVQTLTSKHRYHSHRNHHNKSLAAYLQGCLAHPAQLVFAGKGDPSALAVPTTLHQQHSRYHHHECYLDSIFKKAQVAGYSWFCRCDH